MRSHIGWRGEWSILYKGVETSSKQTLLKILRESLKRTISPSGDLGLLQMVLELNIGQCASEDTEPRRGMNCEIPPELERGTSASDDAGPQRG